MKNEYFAILGAAVFVSFLICPKIGHAAIFTDNFDDPSYTNSNWDELSGIGLGGVWDFVTIDGSDLGYKAVSGMDGLDEDNPAVSIAK